MRIKINLLSQPSTSIPIEYNYNIYLGLRKLLLDFLSANKPKLHSRYKREFPRFTFSQLMIPDRRIEHGFIEITGTYLSFFVSSVDTDFMEYLTRAVHAAGAFTVHEKAFKLKKVETVEEPEFRPEMKFRMLSPLLLIKQEGDKAVFVRPEDGDLNDIFSARLVEDYNTLYKAAYSRNDISFQLDQGFLERTKRLTRLLTIRNVNYKTIFAPFYLKGETDLIRYAYRNGIGEKTQYGLGMFTSAGGSGSV